MVRVRLLDDSVAVAGSGGIGVFSVEGVCVRRFSQHGHGVSVMEVLPGGFLVVASSQFDGAIRVYNPTDGTLVRSFPQNGHGVNVMQVLPNGYLVVASCMSNGN